MPGSSDIDALHMWEGPTPMKRFRLIVGHVGLRNSLSAWRCEFLCLSEPACSGSCLITTVVGSGTLSWLNITVGVSINQMDGIQCWILLLSLSVSFSFLPDFDWFVHTCWTFWLIVANNHTTTMESAETALHFIAIPGCFTPWRSRRLRSVLLIRWYEVMFNGG